MRGPGTRDLVALRPSRAQRKFGLDGFDLVG